VLITDGDAYETNEVSEIQRTETLNAAQNFTVVLFVFGIGNEGKLFIMFLYKFRSFTKVVEKIQPTFLKFYLVACSF